MVDMIDLWEFITVLVLTFALCALLAGIFTAYFGAGKSRKIGVVLIIVGLIVGLVYTLPQIREITGIPPTMDMSEVVANAILIILAAIIGAVIALLLFLGAIMKS
jgi:hypothetical protein